MMKNNVSCLKMIALIFMLQTYSAAEPHASSKIMFVYLHFGNNVVTLLKTKVVDGILKADRFSDKGNIYYEIYSEDGCMLSKKISNFSETDFYDYRDLDGQLKGGTWNDENKLLVLRLPYVPSMKNLFLYSTKTTKKAGLSKTTALSVEKDSLIAVIPLNVEKAQ